MGGERYSIQDLGGDELARHYPDRGPLAESNWYNAVVQTAPRVDGFGSWLRGLRHVNSFLAVLSANTEGLRLVVPADEFATFIPWAEAAVAAERGRPATAVRVQPSATPALALELHLDDDAADDLFRAVLPALPRRDPPRTLGLDWWLNQPLGLWVGLLGAICIGLIGWLVLGRR